MNLPDDWWKEERPLPVLRITIEDILEAIRGREQRESQMGLHRNDDTSATRVYKVALLRTKA